MKCIDSLTGSIATIDSEAFSVMLTNEMIFRGDIPSHYVINVINLEVVNGEIEATLEVYEEMLH